MDNVNKYCINLNLGVPPDISELLHRAQVHHKNRLDKYKHFEVMDLQGHTDAILRKFGARCGHQEIFYSPPGFEISIHTDNGEIGKDHCKINWVFGAPGSKMYWWNPKENSGPESLLTDINTKYLNFKKQDCDLLWSAEVGCPGLINAGIPHSMHNSTTEGRWCVSIMIVDLETNDILQWDKAERIFASLAQR